MGPIFGKAYNKYISYDKDDNPVVTNVMADGTTSTLTGWDAKIAEQHAVNPTKFLTASPDVAEALIKDNPDHKSNSSWRYKLEKFLYDKAFTTKTSWLGNILNKGALPGGLVGGGAGLVGGAIADLIASKLGIESPVSFKVLGALGLGGLGAFLGHQRLHRSNASTDSVFDPIDKNIFYKLVPNTSMFAKRAALYKNPKNFILEKLQADTTVGFAEKAKLAASVRNLETEAAVALKDLVRENLGAYPSQIISKFIFNRQQAGSLFGGLVPILGGALANTLK